MSRFYFSVLRRQESNRFLGQCKTLYLCLSVSCQTNMETGASFHVVLFIMSWDPFSLEIKVNAAKKQHPLRLSWACMLLRSQGGFSSHGLHSRYPPLFFLDLTQSGKCLDSDTLNSSPLHRFSFMCSWTQTC